MKVINRYRNNKGKCLNISLRLNNYVLEEHNMPKTIYTHKHHIIPRHAGGTDDPSNLVELTVEEHALAHKELFEQYGRWQDNIAWKALSGMIDSDEARCAAVSHSNKNRNWSDKSRAKISKANSGLIRSDECKENNRQWQLKYNPLGMLGKNHTNKSKAKMSKSRTGKRFWNNGLTRILAFDCPGDNWVLGRNW